MTAQSAAPSPAQSETPIAGFSRSHAGIITQLEAFAELPELAAAAERARQVAEDTLALFEPIVLEHHADEEGDLFPAVQRSAAEGEERERVQEIVQQLTKEHRSIEELWKLVKPQVKHVAHGKPAELDTVALDGLVRAYIAHARFEEEEFLPLAQQILARNTNHMDALKIALHVRHVSLPSGYI